MSDFDVSMRLQRLDVERNGAEHHPFDWSKLVMAMQICGAVLTIPVGVAGAYSAYRSYFSVEVACQALRGTIISTLDKNVDLEKRRTLARRDVEQFERICAAIDPDAKQVFAGLMTSKPSPLTPAEPAATPAIKVSIAAGEPATGSLNSETAARAPRPKIVATMPAAPSAPATVKPNAAASVAAIRPAVEHPPSVERPVMAQMPPAAALPMLDEPPKWRALAVGATVASTATSGAIRLVCSAAAVATFGLSPRCAASN